MVASGMIEAPTQPPPETVAPRQTRSRKFPWYVYLGLLPTFAVLGLLAYYPAFSGIYHSFFEWRPGFNSPFVGMDNYRTMLEDDLWWKSFRNLGIIFVFGIATWILPLLSAELVISLRSARQQFVFRTLLIAPMAFPGVVTALVWSFIYDPNDGVLNRGLSAAGLDFLTNNWVGDPDTALAALLFVGSPWVASLPFLVFLTTLQNVPQEIFEASALDGAGRWRRFWHVDLPLMASQFRLLFFLAMIGILQYGFVAYLITGGGPDNATQVPILRMLGVAFQGADWGYAATLSTVLFLMTIVLSGTVLLFRRKGDGDARSL